MTRPPPHELPGLRIHAGLCLRWLVVIATAGAAAGCIEPSLVQCDNGLACPVASRCDEVHRGCVLPEQLTVCAGAADGTDCTTGPISGACFDEVCLPRGCGNRVVERGEMCDDGNQISGDGCSGDCRSTERCGNGFVDPGEACDDGNLMSRDGCDSRCIVEDALWSTPIAIAPRFIDGQFTAYDAARGQLVYGSPGATWEWDGARWTYSEPSDAGFVNEVVYYDPDRGRVCMIATSETGIAQLRDWTDGHWRLIDAGDGPALDGLAPQITVAYDTARHRAMVIQLATGAVWTIDAAGSWTAQPGMPGIPGEAVAAFDPASSEIVVETTESIEWVHDGEEWASSPTELGARVSMAFDPERGHLVLVDNAAQTTHERIDGAWSAVDDGEVPCANEQSFSSLPLYYDDRGGALSLFSSTTGALCRRGQVWTATEPPLPFSPVGATFDPVSGSFVVLHNPRPEDPSSPTEAWMLRDGGWQRMETPGAPTGRSSPLAVYSPGRAATVLYGEQIAAPPDGEPSTMPCGAAVGYEADTWSLDGTGWSAVASFPRSGPPCSTNAATYDATHGRVLLATYNEVWSLGDADHTWQRIAAPPSGGHVFHLAWDARSGDLMAARLPDDSPSPLFELRGDDWAPIEIVPSSLNASTTALASDLRAGTVILIESNFGSAWERAGADWHRLPTAPVQGLFVSWTAYDPATGRLLYLGRRDNGTFAAILTRTSATPFESCRAGEDADGDGLAGCDDPDCAWSCR